MNQVKRDAWRGGSKGLMVLAATLLAGLIGAEVGAEEPYNIAWIRQFGMSSVFTYSSGVATDAAGNVFITGTASDLSPNAGSTFTGAFVRKYDTAGNLAWTRQFGTSSDDHSHGVATDLAGNVFITGTTGGDLGGPNAGALDAFVSKYDAAGNLAWNRQLGTSGYDYGNGVATDVAGNAFITGTSP